MSSSASDSMGESRFFTSPRFQQWLDRRMPAATSITLDQKKIFILPSREGLYFVAVTLFMLLAGINYQNSLVFAVAFLLFSLFMVCIFHTYRNLAGLTLLAGPVRSAFAGEDAEFQVILQRDRSGQHEALQLGWNREMLGHADLVDEEELRLRLYVKAPQRGVFNPGRMLVQTHFPVGLFRAWSWVDLNVQAMVYPRPIPAGELPPAFGAADEGEAVEREGSDDFYGMREYHAGDPLKHIAWKSYARNDQLLLKQYAAFVDRRVWLDWEYFPGMDREARLSRLCYWVVKYAKSEDEYGLRLPGLEILPGRGEAHQEKMLKALALFEVPST